MNADGTNVRQLTNNTHRDEEPSWSPDGTQIAFDSDRDGDDEIFRDERRRDQRSPTHQQHPP